MPKKSDYAPHIPPEKAPPCHVQGCGEPGSYKAPKSREELHDYHWFCLEHIREHNKQWNFFEGLDGEDIESFIKDAVTGHRPTWNRATLHQEGRIREHYRQLQDALYEFLAGKKSAPPAPPLTARLRKSLSILDMNYPYTAQELKMQYRIMVKKHHPDMNKGNKISEETFKQITTAYHYLSEHIKTM